MTVQDVRGRVAKVEAMRGDDEVAHGAEDELHQDVLRAIADGLCDDPAGCARIALTTCELDFARWTA